MDKQREKEKFRNPDFNIEIVVEDENGDKDCDNKEARKLWRFISIIVAIIGLCSPLIFDDIIIGCVVFFLCSMFFIFSCAQWYRYTPHEVIGGSSWWDGAC